MFNIIYSLLKGTIKTFFSVCFCCCSCTPERLTGPNRGILAYGIFGNVNVYHAEKSTLDRDSRSHLQTLKTFFKGKDIVSHCSIEGCSANAAVGAHVYYSPESDAAADVCFIIPTCSRHNNIHVVSKADQTWYGGKGVRVKDGTPFTTRKINDAAMGQKGAGKGGGRRQAGLKKYVSEFKYFADQADDLRDAAMLEGSGDGCLP